MNNLNPPNYTDTSDPDQQKICLKKNCPSPFNMNIANHQRHELDVHNVQDLVRKLHDRNLRNKEELAYMQNILHQKIEKNEKAIIALRNYKGERNDILSSFQNLQEQCEYLKSERNNLEAYDNIFFSTQKLRKFEKLEESNEMNFKQMYQELINANIFNECKIKCPNHNAQTVNVLNLQENVEKIQRLLCVDDKKEGAQKFSYCKDLLKNYCNQEQYFEKLHQIKEIVFSIRFNIDCITNKILTQVQGLIQDYQYFYTNQNNFNDKFKFKYGIPRETYENLAEFLSKNQQNKPLDFQIKENIDKFNTILNNLTKTILDIRKFDNHFLDKLKPQIIKITVEVITDKKANVYPYGRDAKVIHLQVEPNSTLLDLFEFLNQDNKWNYQIAQVDIIINHLKYNQQNFQTEQVILQNDDDIQIEFRQ